VPSEPLDLRHCGHEHLIGSYLLETEDGPALVDCGPATCIGELKARLAERGLELRDIRHLLLSHIHLDHAGAAGVLVREHPELTVHVSAIGAPHLIDPSRLKSSAGVSTRVDRPGELAPVPRRTSPSATKVVGWSLPRPRHASHRRYESGDGTFAGDAAGSHPASTFVPPTTAGVDLEAGGHHRRDPPSARPGRLALNISRAEDPEPI
jgi:hypothetical protein